MEIKIENLIKSYDDKEVLNIKEMTIKKGIITSIIGPNGSGKTTLISIIAGLETDYRGTILYDGKVLDKNIIKNMTCVFQKPYLFRRTVYENIDYPLKIRNIDKEKRNKDVLDIIDRLEISDLLDKRADLLSGGESQKVALARAIAFKPRLLLLDEPTSNIDPQSIKVMEREILKFNQDTGNTVLIVTHNMEQNERISNNIIELKLGRAEDGKI